MKLIKIGLFITLLYLLIQNDLIVTSQFETSKVSETSNTSSTLKFSGDKPTAYKLFINFEEENYSHIQTLNNGETEIHVKVSGKPVILYFGVFVIIKVEYVCQIGGPPNQKNYSKLSGTLNYQKNIKIIGQKSHKKVIKKLHQDVIKAILKQLK